MDSRNRDIRSARAYHDRTAHSPESIREDRHRLDWQNQPRPFKIYPDLAAVPLPREFPVPEADAFQALGAAPPPAGPLDLGALTGLLFFSAGVTKRKVYGGGETLYFRAAPSTGALYQTEVYLVAGDVGGLAPGVYHFNPGDLALRRLREGDFRGVLAGAAADEGLAAERAIVILTAIYWRNTWKYQARGYRHLFWDSGAMCAHLLAAAAGLGLPARLVTAFVESQVAGLLGLDPDREGALVLVPAGGPAAAAPPPPPVVPIAPVVIPLSAREVDYPLLRQAYADASLGSEAEVAEWREHAARVEGPGAAPAGLAPLPPPRAAAGRPLGETILARGSTRQFSGGAIEAVAFGSALFHATRGVASDGPTGLVDLYVSVHAVEGLEPGAYLYHPAAHALEPLKAGDFRRDSAFLCLEQSLGGASSATVFFLADLGRLLPGLGNRGYRLANLEAGLIGGRLYLAAYAQRLGATGLTFYDGEVVRFFSPHAAGKDALFVTALGRSVRRPAEVEGLQIQPPSG